MNFETLLKQIVKEAVVEALHELEPKNWTTNDIHAEEVKPTKEPEVEVDEPVEEITEETAEVDLTSMKLKELREYAEELGLNSKGKRAELEERIQEFLNSEPEEAEEDLGEDTEEVEDTEEPSEEAEEAEEEVEEEVDETYAKVLEYANEASDEELRETLEELGLSSKGKREALIEKIYQAVKDGLFEFEEDEEPSEKVEPEEEPEEEVESEEETDMTEERANAIDAMEDQVHEEFEEGKITRKEMVSYLKQVGIAVTKKVTDDDVIDMYTEKLALLIDDEGNFHDEGEDPYTINDVPYCCGAPLEETKDGYKCNVCGTEYEAE